MPKRTVNVLGVAGTVQTTDLRQNTALEAPATAAAEPAGFVAGLPFAFTWSRPIKELSWRSRRAGETEGLLHVTRAVGTHGYVVLKDAGQQLGPADALRAATRCPSCVVVLTALGLGQSTGSGCGRRGCSKEISADTWPT